MKGQTGIWAVFVREWKRIAASKIVLWGFIAAPLLSMLMLMWIMNAGLPTKIPIAVVDHDNSKTSRSLIRQLDAFPKTDIKFKSLSFGEARNKMENMEIYAILTIPRNFAKDATTGKQPKLVYYTNNAFLVSGSLLFQDLKTISTLASASVGLQTMQAKGYRESQIMPVIQPISVEAHPLNNPWLNYSIYLNSILLPAILQLVILLFTVSSIGSEIKSASGRELMQIGNGSIFKVILGKTLPYTILATMIALCFMSVLYGYYNFPLNGGFWSMFLNYFLLIIATQGFGIMLMGWLRNYRFSLSVASLIGMITFSLIGMSFPVLAMDAPLQMLSNLVPMRHFMLIYIDQGLNGIPFQYSINQYIALLCFVLVGMLFSGFVKKELEHNVYEP